ncbi:peptidase M61 domain protein [mine drainage metagenome]|uniref:Peptidase M61 domain protein n=1 Tax=mine drainage metagenome TaxID=410659 RepID=T1AFP0_9ZZZZ
MDSRRAFALGPLANVVGVEISGNGQRIAWRRDLTDMYALHPDVPQGVSRIELKFQFLSPGSGGEFGRSVSATPRLVDPEWNQVVFYPAGHYSRAISLRPRVKLPPAGSLAARCKPPPRRTARCGSRRWA